MLMNLDTVVRVIPKQTCQINQLYYQTYKTGGGDSFGLLLNLKRQYMKKLLLTVILAAAGLTGVSAQKVVTLDDTQNLTTKINSLAGVGGKYVKFTDRAVYGDIWNVLVLPFDTDVASVSKAFGYAAVDILDETTASGNIHFKTITGKIPANTPFLVKPTSNPRSGKTNYKDITFTNVTLKEVTEKVEVSDAAGNKFVGIYAPTTFYGKKYWYLSKGFWYGSSLYSESRPVELRALRAYVDYTGNSMKARPVIIIDEPDGTTTAIDVATFNEGEFATNGDQDKAWYTLTGSRLTEVPTSKGVYIHQGRKVIIK